MLYKKKRGDIKPHASSIILNLKPVLAARNITTPSAFLLSKGLNNVTVTKMLRGDAVQLNFRQLTTLCLHLRCTPNDLFETRAMDLPAGHPLEALAPKPDIQSIEEFLNGKTVEEVAEMLRKTGE